MIRRCASILVLIVVTGGAAHARAQNVKVQVSTRETYVGLPIQVQVTIENATDHEPPEFPPVDGATVQALGGSQSSRSVSIVNGRMTQQISVRYTYQVTPTREGTIAIGPISVVVDGRTQQTAPFEIVAVKSETGDLLFVEVKGNRNSVYVGELLGVTLQVWLKPYSDRQYRYKFSAAEMWNRVDVESSRWGVFAETLRELYQRRDRPQGRETPREDADGNRRSYYLYEIEQALRPERAGRLDVGDVSVVVSYPVRLDRNRNFFSMFNDLQIAETRPVTAGVVVDPIEVKPIPTEGRPPFYRGAVGQYEFEVTAKPTVVRVGDPITLTLTLRGSGRLDLLQAPPLSEISPLTAEFQVPDETMAGIVENGVKQFTQSIRAKNDQVTEIPPIPFAYFDPSEERFVTIESEPIPLRVQAAERMAASQIVESQAPPVVATRLTELSGGIVANYTDMDEVLTSQAFRPGMTSAVVVVAPLFYVFCWAARRRSDRLRHDRGYARRRSARKHAQQAIADAGRSTDGLTTAVADALIGYVADRCDLPAAGLTRAEAVAALAGRDVTPELVQRVDALLGRCDDVRYAGLDQTPADNVATEAKQCIAALEQQRF